MEKKNARALCLMVTTLTYLLLGAAVFDALESELDQNRRVELARMKRRMVQKYNFTHNDWRVLEVVVIKSIPHKAGYQWKFAGAFYFATVVVTTVGYGHSTPSTFEGRMFCIVFAIAGIPLSLVMFQSIGERLNTFISYALMKIRKSLGMVQVKDAAPFQLIFVSSSIGLLVISLGAYVFHKYEHWSLFEGFYYCVMTLNTIGFGDYVALQTNNKLQRRPGYVVFTLVFVLFGLAVFSSVVNLFVLRFMASNTGNNNGDSDIPKTVVLETFGSLSDDDERRKQMHDQRQFESQHGTPNGSLILENSCPLHSPSSFGEHGSMVPLGVDASRTQMTSDRCRRRPGRTSNFRRHVIAPLRNVVCACCCGGNGSHYGSNRAKNQMYYTVRRNPTPHIGHLLAEFSPDDERESFLLKEMKRRLSL